MEFTSFGAARTVTGSKHLLRTESGKTILLDCGLFQGRDPRNPTLNTHFGFDPRSIDYLILSHAHIDHSGLIPKLVKEGFTGPIFATQATLDLCGIMLPDSGHIQEADVAFSNKFRKGDGRTLKKPLYTVEDAYACLRQFRAVSYHEWHELDEDLAFQCIPNGHLLGSAAIVLSWKDKASGTERRLAYTGDIGRPEPNMLKAPMPLPEVDYLICESTYGDRLHDNQDFGLTDLVQLIRETCVDRKGKLIIPAFSIGRTQEIVFALDYLHNFEMLPSIPVYVDSPLSTKGTEIYRKHLDAFNAQFQRYLAQDATPFAFPQLHFIESADESKALNDSPDPCIIISASGMMEAGRIRHHLFNHIEHSNNTLLIVGYSEPSSLGGQLTHGARTIRLFRQELQVKARVEVIQSYSGHADYREILHYLHPLNQGRLKDVFLVHGDYESQLALAARMHRQGFPNVEIPDRGQTRTLA